MKDLHDGSRRPGCRWCRDPIPKGKRRDSRFCSVRCRQAHWRFARDVGTAEATGNPLRLGYADPPYPGLAHYYRHHPDYAGEVDHVALVASLSAEFDGWALSTSARALPAVLGMCVGLDVAVAAWFRGSRPARSRRPLPAWEPVIYHRARRAHVSSQPGDDALVHVSRPRTTDPSRVIGSKPAAFCSWMFGLLGAREGDSFDDLYPGSGGVRRAWELWSRRASSTDAS